MDLHTLHVRRVALDTARVAIADLPPEQMLSAMIALHDGPASDYTVACVAYANANPGTTPSANAANNLARAYGYGVESYNDPDGIRAPGAHAGVLALVAGMAVGTGAAQTFRAFSQGWDWAAEEAARLILAGE